MYREQTSLNKHSAELTTPWAAHRRGHTCGEPHKRNVYNSRYQGMDSSRTFE